MRRRKVSIILGVVVLIIGGAVFVRIRSGDIQVGSGGEEALGEQAGEEGGGPVIPAPVAPAAPTALAPSKLGENLKTYTHPKPKFSIDFPEDLEVQIYDEGGESKTIVFSGPSGSFQIFFSPYDGDDSLSAADVARTLPSTKVEEPQEIRLPEGVSALLFWSSVPEIGKTREVWIARGGWRFAVTARASADAWLAHIMTTWRFDKN